MTKEELKQKETLKTLARDIKFQSVMFSDEFGYSNRESLRYYLWMCELNLWLFTTLNFSCIGDDSYNDVKLQTILIHSIILLQENNKLPKREKK
jgi:hypothetical protein